MNNKVRILSIDGGGIRGIIPAVVLEYVENKLKEKSGNPDAVLHDYFDMIAGTSTGGILTCYYLHPERLPAGKAIELYAGNGSKIFKKPVGITVADYVKSLLFSPKYTKKGLEKALNETFGDYKLSDIPAGKHSLVTAYDIVQCKSVFYTVPEARFDPYSNYYLKDVARATSAAPTYFAPVAIKSMGYDLSEYKNVGLHHLIDGAMFANDPSLCAVIEARKTRFERCEQPAVKDIYLVSIGTGKEPKPIMYSSAVKWGLKDWVRPVLDIMMWASPEVVNYQLNQLFELAGCHDCYMRLDPGLLNAKPDMDIVTDENIKNLLEAGIDYVEKNKGVLDKIADSLIYN